MKYADINALLDYVERRIRSDYDTGATLNGRDLAMQLQGLQRVRDAFHDREQGEAEGQREPGDY